MVPPRVALGQNATLMGETFRILALLVLSLPAIVVLALVGTRMLGVRRSWVAIAISGVVGWVVGLAVAFAVSGGTVRDAEFLRNALLLGFLATMTTAVALDLLAKPGTLSQGDAAGRFVMPRPKRYVEERVDVVRRSREIAEILRANGFGPQLGWTRRRREEAALARDAAPVRARQALEQCGGMFVKLGQIASTRSDLLPPEFIDELSKLQSDVAPADPVAIRALIEAELGAPVGEVFSEFDWDPIGTASIAQVYRATLHSGEPVVVKAQRPEIPEIVRRDTEVLLRVAGAVERNTPWGESYQVSTIAKDFADGVRAELDFRQEGRNAAAIGSNMASIPGVVVPRVFDDYTTSRVLVQERFDGPEASDDGALADRSLDRRHLADVLLRAALKQMMTDGWFHADLHPGNVLVLGAGAAARLGIIDFGACGRLDPLQQAALRQMLIATALRDAGMLRQAVADTCEIGAEVDDESLERALARFLALNVQPGQAVSATAVSDLMQLLTQFGIQVPVEFTTFGRALVVLDGTLRVLAPGYQFSEAAQGVATEWVSASSDDEGDAGEIDVQDLARQELIAQLPTLRDLPRRTDRVLRLLERGDVTTRVSLFARDEDTRFVATMVNRATLAFIGAAVALVSVLLLVSDGGPAFAGDVTLFQFLGYVGLFGATVLLLRVIAAIVREGRN
jgi:ubiquinone biosynthesis protein